MKSECEVVEYNKDKGKFKGLVEALINTTLRIRYYDLVYIFF